MAVSILKTTTQRYAMIGEMQTKEVAYSNLDAMISVGYRVDSQKATPA